MKKAPMPAIGVGAIREAVRRKSVGLSFTTNFSLFNRSASGSTGDDDDSRSAAASTAEASDRKDSGADDDDLDDSDLRHKRYNRSDSYQGDELNGTSDGQPSPVINGQRTSYVEPPEPPSLPPGGLLEAATKNVQGKMKDLMETYHEVTTSLDDSTVQCSVFLSRSALFSDRLVVFLGDSDGCPAGVWSAKLCVRSGHGGGGIFKGSLGSMLPYIVKSKEDKLGIVMYDDVFRESVRSGEIDNLDKLYMVMDYYSGGSLRQVLRRRGRFSIKRARFYLAQILLAIAHLHASHILYRDLKLENIVISADGNVACTDFGLSKQEMTDQERTSSFVGTCEYLAPELILKEGYGKAVDWWAFGILAFEMIQGDSPFRHQQPTVLFEKILKDEPVFSDRFTPDARDLITKLLTKDPTYRLGCGAQGVEEIKQHPFFAEIDWEGLLQKRVEVPRPPHRMEDVTDESHLTRAIAKMREAREELMPDSPVSLPSSPSEQKHFDRFSYQGLDGWHPSMANMRFDEESGDFQPDTIAEDEEYDPDSASPGTETSKQNYIDHAGDGPQVPLSPGSLTKESASSKTSKSSSATSQSPPPAPVSPGTPTPGTPTPGSPGTPDMGPSTPKADKSVEVPDLSIADDDESTPKAQSHYF
ncbi:hypothetical protein ATCC90586_008715 [Pythium insidiosum]|nr:hypothetical protein ATCC90586_008715 [Pythium insidiosum]